MIVTIFTGSQPRHQSLIREVARVCTRVYAVMEVTTVFPGKVDDFFRASPVMQDYFSRVTAAERVIFGDVGFMPENVCVLPIKMGDIGRIDIEVLTPALVANQFCVFGASYIKKPLIDALMERRAINIHMGVSPYYRGSSCNFWAMYDGRPDLVGATIHLLSRGLDSGDMLFHALPKAQEADPFEYGMLSVLAAHRAFVSRLESGELQRLKPVPQDRTREIRYMRNEAFTDAVAGEYLARLPSPAEISARLSRRDSSLYLNPVFV